MRVAAFAMLIVCALCDLCGCDGKVETRALMAPAGVVELADTSHGYLGLMFESIDSVPLVVSDCVPGGGAESAGVQPMDVLISLNGHASPSFQEIHQLIANTEPGDVVVAMFQRGNSPVSIDFPTMSFKEIQDAMEAERTERELREANES